ncbi:AAA family ATPase [Streptomyces sp. DSM 44915]|uniref:AAA family ATPase n=1 Tax=Streptomyces chisholmiae TaxID=3075540 RepID=A0ABU2K0I2_9ACTN|nr:AAA family ATPase [Streptomyces sp. DSM 44915]MDT0270489.1 AAA family ATPase [Streptomyces sp. DSM 44915]
MREKTRATVRELAREVVAAELAEGAAGAMRQVAEEAARDAVRGGNERLVAQQVRRQLADDGEFRPRLLAEAVETAARASQRAVEASKLDFMAFARARAEQVFAETARPVVEIHAGQRPPVSFTEVSHRVLPDLLVVLAARCHALLVGPAGTGKSTLAQQAASALGLEFHALSLGPTTPMSKIFGYYDAHGTYHATPFRRAFEHGGLMLLDELDSGHPGLLSELNQALSLGVCAFADDMVTAHPDFRVVATANTYGTGPDRQYTGRQALDAATLDRFTLLDVPVDERLEEQLTLAHAPTEAVAARAVLKKVQWLRSTAERKRLPVMFSPRASIESAKLLEAGASLEQVMEWRVLRGVSAAHRSALGEDEGNNDGPPA